MNIFVYDENDSKGRHTKITLHNVILTMFVFFASIK